MHEQNVMARNRKEKEKRSGYILTGNQRDRNVGNADLYKCLKEKHELFKHKQEQAQSAHPAQQTLFSSESIVYGQYLVFGHGTNDQRAHHARERAHAVRDAHQNTGVARSDVQMIYIEP